MRKINLPVATIVLLLCFFGGCQKQLNYSVDAPGIASVVKDSVDNCSGITIHGEYTAAKPLNGDNYITVNVNVDSTGVYNLATDTINGYYFRAEGSYERKGINTIKLPGFGTPVKEGTDAFTIYVDNSYCNFEVTVQHKDSTTGEEHDSASISFVKGITESKCSETVVIGTYIKGQPLGDTNYVMISVDVSKTGPYTISATSSNGFSFYASGIFTETGVHRVRLSGSGTPVDTGNTFTVLHSPNSSNDCNFNVHVKSADTGGGTDACGQENNTGELEGISTFDFSYVLGMVAGSTYNITGNSLNGDLEFEFAANGQPAPGEYKIVPLGADFYEGRVRVNYTASDIYWQSDEGKVYVTVKEGKVTASFCNVNFSGSFGSTVFHSVGRGKVTEQ